MMTVNELITTLQELVEQRQEISEYIVTINDYTGVDEVVSVDDHDACVSLYDDCFFLREGDYREELE